MNGPLSPALPAGFSIKDVLRRRIINDMLRVVQPAARWKLLVVDPLSMKILASAMKMFDVLEENVTAIELITKSRQPYDSYEAIYFLSPTPESIAHFIVDFVPGGGKKRLYAAGHLFFTGTLPDALMERLTSSGAARYIKSLKELYVDFHTLESRVLSLDLPKSFFRLYSPDAGGLMAQNAELDRIAKKLVSVCATLGESPYIRYHKSTNPDNIRCHKLATMLAVELDTLSKLDPSFAGDGSTPKATLLILDRTQDVVSTILHEFTYQAMANDLLPLEEGKYSYAFANADGSDGKKDVVLDENDALWVQLRHLHIAETIQTVMASFNKFINENKAASSAMGGKKRGDSYISKGEATNLTDMKDTLAAMPQFQELKQKYSVHINMAQECMAMFERRKLAQSAGLEQDMATGLTADGATPKGTVTDMVPLLDDDAIPPLDKVRLLMLYIISKEGVQDDDRRKLLDHAKINFELAESITNLALLGVKLTRDQKRDKPKDKKAKKKGEEVPYELSRYVCHVKFVLEDQISNTLDANLYPYLGPKPDSDDGTGRGGTSLRSTKPNWQKKGNDKERDIRSGGKIIVFMLGGMTYAEIRSVYEISQTLNREVLIGSSHVVTPTKFITDLQNLRQPKAFKEEEYGQGEGPKQLPELSDKERKKIDATDKKTQRSASVTAPIVAGQAEEKKKKKLFGLF